MASKTERLRKNHTHIRAWSGPASYADTGSPGRPVLFVYGVGSGSYPRRHASERPGGQRRCAVVGLPPHGPTPV